MNFYEFIKLSTIEKGEFGVKQKAIENLLLRVTHDFKHFFLSWIDLGPRYFGNLPFIDIFKNNPCQLFTDLPQLCLGFRVIRNP